MRRRKFLKLGASFGVAANLSSLFVGCEGLRVDRAGADKAGPARLSDLDAFNYVIGTSAIAATYQFTQEPLLVEQAQAVLDAGANVIKIAMGRDYQRMMLKASKTAYPETVQFLQNQGADAKDTVRVQFPGAAIVPPPANPAIQTLGDLARLDPSYRRVFEMPFAHYVIWTYAFTPRWWRDGFPAAEQEKEYNELYDFVAYLLKSYSGTGKKFFLGHWEGGWHLRPELNTQSDAGVTPVALQGMTDWLNARQRAVDDAKRRTRHHGVDVFHYTEANLVIDIAMKDRPGVANRVLPRTNVDYVSYSSYDSLDDIQNKLPRALSYLATQIPKKSGIEGPRVMIGEYGFPARFVAEVERARKARQIMRIGLAADCPFVLCWQMFNNEYADKRETGFWLIDDKGVKQPIWNAHHDFLHDARGYVREFKRKEKRLPTSEEFRRFGFGLLERLDRGMS